MNLALIASALPHYLESEHRGVMVPCTYYKEKSPGMAETGVAYFVGPDAASKSESADPRESLYDDVLGKGATRMIFDMVRATVKAREETHLRETPVIGVDLRPRSAMDRLFMDFVIAGSQVFVVKDQLFDTEPVWHYLIQAGFARLPYAPMWPAVIPDVPPADRLPRI
jgi:hypothetical protein